MFLHPPALSPGWLCMCAHGHSFRSMGPSYWSLANSNRWKRKKKAASSKKRGFVTPARAFSRPKHWFISPVHIFLKQICACVLQCLQVQEGAKIHKLSHWWGNPVEWGSLKPRTKNLKQGSELWRAFLFGCKLTPKCKGIECICSSLPTRLTSALTHTLNVGRPQLDVLQNALGRRYSKTKKGWNQRSSLKFA